MKNIKPIVVLLLITCAFLGCETALNETQTGALAGGGLGAGLGAIIGSQTGHGGAGTAIGAGAGALTGALVGEGMRRQRQRTETQMAEMEQRLQAQQYQQGTYQQYPTSQQQYTPPAPQAQVQEIHTKYNPRTGQTFPERYTYDPVTGEELKYLQ